MTYPSKYKTSKETLSRMEFLSNRIIRQTEFYEQTKNKDVWLSNEADIAEKGILFKLYTKQLKDENS